MSAHGIAVRALGVVTVAYAAALAWAPVQLVRAASSMGEVMTVVATSDPETREALAQEGFSPEVLKDELAGRYRREVLAQQAPALVRAVVGVAAGILLVLRRRAGAWLLLAFLLWPLAAWGYHAAREALFTVKLRTLDTFTLPLARRGVHLELLGRAWDVDGDAFFLGVQVTFSVLASAILAWAFVAERRKGARA